MPVLTLIRTAPDFPPGSMPAYAHLVLQAVKDNPDFQVQICDFFDPHGGGSMRRHHVWRLLRAPSFFSHMQSDVYHLLDGSMAGFLPPGIRKKTIVTVHDLIPFLQLQGHLPGCPGFGGRWVIRRSVQALREVAGLAAVSDYTRRDLAEATGRSDIHVIHLPVRTLGNSTGSSRSDLPEHYLLHVGNNAGYKNRTGVLNVFSKLKTTTDLHLVMAGPEPTPGIREKAESLGRVRFVVNITDAELAVLYRNAAVFLFPSFYEGFGMPVLEAMAAGCPVVCSSSASLPEVVGDAALLAPPEDIERLANHCQSLLSDPAQRNEMSRRGRQRVEQFTLEHLSKSLHAWYLQYLNQAGDPK